MKTKIYSFERLDKNLDKLGFPRIKGSSGFQVIKGIDFEEAYKSGSISFEENRIMLEYEGKKYTGYLFIQEAYITYNGGPVKFPKFHLLKCKKIQEFIAQGRFNQRYEWSNSDVNNLLDKQTKARYDDIKLDVCSYCKSEYFQQINDTKEFFDSLDKSELDQANIEVDIFGYVRGKERISKEYRESQNFKCESCAIQPSSNLHKRWWHTHHIDGDKTNNEHGNLKCLCIVCHSNLDARHKLNFSKGSMPRQIEQFKKQYSAELKALNNPYLEF